MPADWCGETDAAYVADWTRWAERQRYHRWSANSHSEFRSHDKDYVPTMKRDDPLRPFNRLSSEVDQ
jgi:hypothetical protein